MLWEFMLYQQAHDDNYEFELRRAGFASRWHVPYPLNYKVPFAVCQAYAAKVQADNLTHDMFRDYWGEPMRSMGRIQDDGRIVARA